MKRGVISILLIAAVAAGAAFATRGTWTPLITAKQGAKLPAAERAKYFYTCPMHPQIVKERPGDCPICGMALVKKEVQPATGKAGMENMTGMTHEKHAAAVSPEVGRVALDPRQRLLANVKTTKVVEKAVSEDIRTVGKIAVDERSLRKVTARYAGRVERLAVDFTGRQVKKGEIVMSVYSPELIATEKEYFIARKAADRLKKADFPEISRGSESAVEAARTRLRLWGLTDAQIATLDRTGEVKETVDIYSPVSGTVMEIKVRQGEYVSEGSEVFTIADLGRVWMQADVYEYEFSKVGMGSEAEVTADAFPGRMYRGRVSFIDPSVDPQSRTVKVRVELPNPGGRLKPEMFVNARIFSRPVHAAVVPASAILYTGTRNVAWVEVQPGVFEPRDVKLGLRSGDEYQVLSGLRAGETVVSEGGFLIDSEAQLKQAAGGAMPGMNMDEKPAAVKPATPAPTKPKDGMKGMPGM